MIRVLVVPCFALAVAMGLAACASSGAGGRPIEVTQSDSGCTPTTIDATAGEKLDLKVKNTTGKDYEVEGIEGANLEEVIIPGRRTREVGFKVPSEGGTSKIKCYVPGGVSTIIEVRAEDSGAPAADGATPTGSTPAEADATVNVGLTEFTVSPSVTSVAAGRIRFEATNDSTTMVHELAVLRVKDDGSFENMGEVEDLEPDANGSVVIELTPGDYQLACLIVPGEAGSTVDHYQQGMHTAFTVE